MFKTIFSQHRTWLAITYFLNILEFTLFAAMPFLLGMAVDSMMKDQMTHFWIYITLSTFAWFVGRCRRRLDTRVFSRIWIDRAINGIKHLTAKGTDPADVVSRAGMAHTVSHFLEFTVPAAICAMVEIIVAAIMISWVLPWHGFVLCSMAAAMIANTYLFSWMVLKIERKSQDIREAINRKVIAGEVSTIEEDYALLRKNAIRQSDLEALNWCLVDIVMIIGEVMVLFAVVANRLSVGEIMATLAYTTKLFSHSAFIYHFFSHYRQVGLYHGLLEEK